MTQLNKYYILSFMILGLLTSCDESRQRATDKLNEFNEQADEFNSKIDDGLREIESFDSVVRSGAEKIKEYDSLVKKSSSKIDSIAKEKAKAWEESTNY